MSVLQVFSGGSGAAAKLAAGAASTGLGVASKGVGAVTVGLAAADRTTVVAGDLAGRLLLRGVDQALAWRYTAEALDRVLRSTAAEQAVVQRVAGQLFESPDFERAVMSALERGGAGRLMAQALEPRLLDDLVRRVLDSDELRPLADGTVRRPVGAAAVRQASAEPAEDVATDDARGRSRGSDTWRVARRISLRQRDDRRASPLLVPRTI